MVEVKWTDFAIQNLNEIGDYIEKKSYTSYASRVVSGLFAAVDVLERFPLAGRMVPEFQDTTIRELIRMNHYRIVYRVVNERYFNCSPFGSYFTCIYINKELSP